MSSSPRSDRSWRPVRWSLRSRLTLALVAIVAGVTAVIGVATTVAVYQFQVGRLDAQLAAAAGRTRDAGPRPPLGGDDPRARNPPPLVQGLGTIATHRDALGVQTQQAFTANGWQELSDDQLAVLLAVPHTGHPFTRDIPRLGTYRLQAAQAPDHDLIFTRLPMDEVEATQHHPIGLGIPIGPAAAPLAPLPRAGLIGRH